MSSNSINYDDEPNFFDNAEVMVQMNDIEGEAIFINKEPDYIQPDEFNLQSLSKNELIEKLETIKINKRKYIRKYQKTNKGRIKTREASKKYYHQNREAILQRKKFLYQQKKSLNN